MALLIISSDDFHKTTLHSHWFKDIVKENLIKQQQEMGLLKLPSVKKVEIKPEDIEFEKNLNETIEKLLERQDLKEFNSKYENHLRVIYDIYSF